MPDLEMKEDLPGLENREKSKSACDASARRPVHRSRSFVSASRTLDSSICHATMEETAERHAASAAASAPASAGPAGAVRSRRPDARSLARV